MKDLRPAIIRAHNRGKKQNEIADFLGISQGTVSKAIKRFEETGSNQDRAGRGRPRKARTPINKRKIKGRIQRNPSSRKNSTRKMAAVVGISKSSVHRILRKDLNLKSRREAEAQNLEERKMQKRAERCPMWVLFYAFNLIIFQTFAKIWPKKIPLDFVFRWSLDGHRTSKKRTKWQNLVRGASPAPRSHRSTTATSAAGHVLGRSWIWGQNTAVFCSSRHQYQRRSLSRILENEGVPMGS